jgi:hypothetical protein
VSAEEQSRLAPAITKFCQHLQGISIENMHLVIRTICNVDKLLIIIPREGDIPGRT